MVSVLNRVESIDKFGYQYQIVLQVRKDIVVYSFKPQIKPINRVDNREYSIRAIYILGEDCDLPKDYKRVISIDELNKFITLSIKNKDIDTKNLSLKTMKEMPQLINYL